MANFAMKGVKEMRFKEMVKGGLIVPERVAMELKDKKADSDKGD